MSCNSYHDSMDFKEENTPENGMTHSDDIFIRMDKSTTLFNSLQDAFLSRLNTEHGSSSPSTSTSTSTASISRLDDDFFSQEDSTHFCIPKTCTLNVPCLKSIDDLMDECTEIGLTFNFSTEQVSNGQSVALKRSKHSKSRRKVKKLPKEVEETFEVDLILDEKVEKGEKLYFVKWKSYPFSCNTWEPRKHLSGCSELLDLFEIVKRRSSKMTLDILNFFIKDVVNRKPLDVLTLRKIFVLFYSRKAIPLTGTELVKEVRMLINNPILKVINMKGKMLDVIQFSHKRQHTLVNLKEWEQEINFHCPNSPYITVENEVDVERAPVDFKFIPDYLSTFVEIPDDPLVGCSCTDCYINKNCCCPSVSDGSFAYNCNGTIRLLPGFPVYECNKRCACGPDCKNRVVQHGSKVKLAIFRTTNGRGWGLKTLETIKKDQFVVEYLGEIITQAEAERRGQIYDAVGRSYLFDLDFEIDDCSFTVDAGHLGNASHFMNHSCDPNVIVFAVWINQLDPHLPRLAFFAKRKIMRGEELTFDYKGKKPSVDDSDPPTASRIECKCGARNCRKFLYQ